MYTDSQRALQDAFDSRRLADRIEERLVQSELDAQDIALIERQFMFFLATTDEAGHPNCSFKGGSRGFVRVLDSRTLAFPDYNGNGMYLSLGNVRSNGQVGLLFIDFERQDRLRVNGVATMSTEDPLLAEYPGAQMIVRVDVREAFPNCSRYIPKMEVIEESRYVPRANLQPPPADWKQSDWACDVLPQSETG